MSLEKSIRTILRSLQLRGSSQIPHIKAIKLGVYKNYGGGVFKLALVHNDTECSCSWSQFGSTYEEDELKDIMAQGIEKYCNQLE